MVDNVRIDVGSSYLIDYLIAVEHESVATFAVIGGVVNRAESSDFVFQGVGPKCLVADTVVKVGGTIILPVVLHCVQCVRGLSAGTGRTVIHGNRYTRMPHQLGGCSGVEVNTVGHQIIIINSVETLHLPRIGDGIFSFIVDRMVSNTADTFLGVAIVLHDNRHIGCDTTCGNVVIAIRREHLAGIGIRA